MDKRKYRMIGMTFAVISIILAIATLIYRERGMSFISFIPLAISGFFEKKAREE